LEADRKKRNTKLKYQYAFVMIGVFFALSIGGFVYQYYNINGVAFFGIIIESLALAALILFFVVSLKRSKETRMKHQLKWKSPLFTRVLETATRRITTRKTNLRPRAVLAFPQLKLRLRLLSNLFYRGD